MIDANRIAKPLPTVKVADLGGARVAVVTVTSAIQRTFPDGEKVQVTFEEFEGKTYFPNMTSLRNLVDGLGADETKWKGNRVVLEVTKTNDPRFKNKMVEGLWVAPAEFWADHMESFDRRAERAPVTPKAAAPKASGKKK